ncbi:hypothetical protein J7I98_23835 [Streptomyces sp. ISL-98]|uniref:hypothetical protein n=1 Tax=Streptomyces sp. ISL-98 TaxID=2819192 RepID=UPI001BE7D0F1|nr:hypothetical protein [Streptomyces sp. ISL-98]MBT2508862.1 hypothetical protein [Streptomyces sp. ISL-98]
MFGSKGREIARLRQLLEVRTGQRSNAITLAGVLQGNAVGTVVRVDQRRERALRACARYLDAIHARDRRIRSLEGQLDNLLGLDNPQIAAGAHRQDRRTDKPREVQP